MEAKNQQLALLMSFGLAALFHIHIAAVSLPIEFVLPNWNPAQALIITLFPLARAVNHLTRELWHFSRALR